MIANCVGSNCWGYLTATNNVFLVWWKQARVCNNLVSMKKKSRKPLYHVNFTTKRAIKDSHVPAQFLKSTASAQVPGKNARKTTWKMLITSDYKISKQIFPLLLLLLGRVPSFPFLLSQSLGSYKSPEKPPPPRAKKWKRNLPAAPLARISWAQV